MKTRPDVALLQSLFHYDPETGHLTRRPGHSQWARHHAGERAGYVHKSTGYRHVKVAGYCIAEHRVAWAMQTGAWPEQIDHLDTERTNNRWSNLREASNHVNAQNRRGPYRGSATGILGVHARASGRFRASIKVSGRMRHIGTFDTADQAHAAYVAAKRIHHPGCTL